MIIAVDSIKIQTKERFCVCSVTDDNILSQRKVNVEYLHTHTRLKSWLACSYL